MTGAARNGVVAAVCGALAVLVAAGCSVTVDGTAAPVGMRYRAHVTSDDAAARLADRDSARLLDPCGLLDEQAVNRLGTVLHFGIDIELDECAVHLDRTTRGAPLNGVKVTMSVAPAFSGATLQIGGRKASELSLPEQCSIAVEYNQHRAILYTGNGGRGTNPCPAMRALAAASAPLLDNPPRRVNSTKIPPTKGATVDLCSALDTAYTGESFYLTGLSPYTCDYWLGQYTSDDSNRFTISLYNAHQRSATYIPSDARKLQIAGADAMERSSAKNYCVIDAYVGVQHPIPARDWEGKPDDRVEALKISGRNCDSVRSLAVAAVRTYRQN
ncbi:DUF3558 family protein [Nocardia brasiliensis]|uniref:DUF3558 family protein n=1 Tax=Nocardia brasiliensis TaxID=37326 RepID=UPI0024586B0D|nr:DUF3558 family protein [Nocardia brasiliensis]